jgi:hypothetical protein
LLPEVTRHPSVERLARVARALGALLDRVVFIGGAIVPLLQIERVLRSPRVTKDVDGVVASSSYTNFENLQDALRSAGFREAIGAHVHRWLSPDEDSLDLMPEGEHLGTTGKQWDTLAIETSVALELLPGVIVRHASTPGFLALKFAAYNDRGIDSPLDSHDLEDIIAVVVSRTDIAGELVGAPSELRAFVARSCQGLLENPDASEILSSHLNNAYDRASAATTAMERLGSIASAH